MANYNRNPYYDDFDKTKNFYKVLFAAGRPVQARELNQIQSIWQNQQMNFANNIFKNGTRVEGGTPTFNTLSWVRLNKGAKVDWFNKEIPCIAVGMGDGTGNGSGLKARVIDVAEETTEHPATLFVVYENIAVDGETTSFLWGEKLAILSGEDRVTELTEQNNRPNVRCPSCSPTKTVGSNTFNVSSQIQSDVFATDSTINPTGNGTKQIVVAAGVWYHDGIFIDCEKKSLIFSKYGEPYTGKIGFDVFEEVVTASDDATLYDNALGFPNEKAEGADRVKISLNLMTKTLAPEDGDRFIIIATIENGEITSLVEDTQYNKIMDVLAQRTYEESGNYTVKPFELKYLDHKADFKDDAQAISTDGNDDYVRAFVSTGIAYVYGYRYEKKFNTYFDVKKARDTVTTETASIYFNEGAYVDLIVTNGSNPWANNSNNDHEIFTNEDIELKDGDTSSGSAGGTVVGTMKVWDCKYLKDVNGEPMYRYYIADISMHDGKNLSDIKSATNVATNFIAKVPDKGFFVMNASNTNLFWTVGVPFVKSLRDIDNDAKGSMIISRRYKFVGTVGSGGTANEVSFQAPEVASADLSTVVLSVKDGGIWKRVDPTGKVSVSGKAVKVSDPSLSGKDVMLVCTLQSVNIKEKTKTLIENHEVTLNKTSTSNFTLNMGLGKADIIKVKSIKSADDTLDLSSYFTVDDGQRPYAYLEAKLILNNTLPSGVDDVKVTFDYLEHSDSDTAGYFTIDSYKTIIENRNDYNYGNLPTVTSSDGNVYSVSQIIDFRPVIVGSTITSSTMPALNTNAIHDATYYVGRKDYVYIDKDGVIAEQYGVPADKPNLPNKRDDSMNLFEVYFPPYTYSASDIRVKKIENKRYTMRDIGKLEQRIDTLEYYTTLSMAETALANEKFMDGNGLEKFKNGFIVDSFVNYSIADTSNPEYRALNDSRYRNLMPNVHSFNRPLTFDANNSANRNTKVKARVLTVPYTHEMVDQQPYASKSVSINEAFIYRRKGSLRLMPNHNTWSETEIEPKITWDIDTGVDAVKGLSNQINKVQKDFNTFQMINMTVTKPATAVEYNTRSSVSRQTYTTSNTFTTSQNLGTVSRRNPWFGDFNALRTLGGWTNVTTTNRINTYRTTTTTTNTIQTDNTYASIHAKESKIGEKKSTYSTEFLTSAKIIPYMKESKISFYATGMIPNCKLYLFFDDVDVTKYATCYNGSTNQDYVLSNDKGIAFGVVNIPKGRFLNGTKILKITNDRTNSGDVDMEQCYASAQYFAGGLDLTKQELELNVVSPTFTEVNAAPIESPAPVSTSSRVIDSQSTSITTLISSRTIRRSSNRDPIGQSFMPLQNQFLTKLVLYFAAKDPDDTKEIFVEIRPLVNGYPSSDTIIAKKALAIADINVSDDASVGTEVEFDVPVYVEGNKEYVFLIGGDSPETKAYVSKVGGKAINYNNQEINTQPSLGVRFTSQNGTTWNAIQEEDIKYDLYVANFTTDEAVANFIIDKDFYDYEYVGDYAIFGCEQGKTEIRIHTPHGHGLVPDDYARINLMEGKTVKAELTSRTVPNFGNAKVNIKDTSNNIVATATIATANNISGSIYEITLKDCDGFAYLGDIIEVQGGSRARNEFLAAVYDKRPIPESQILTATLKVTDGLPTRGTDTFNGIPYHELSPKGGHKVIKVESAETFIIRVTTPADQSGRFRHVDTHLDVNHKFEMANLSCSMMVYDGSEEWEMTPTTHYMEQYEGSVPKSNYAKAQPMIVSRHENVFTQKPYKIFNKVNGDRYSPSRATIEYKLTYKGNKYVAPMLNLDSLSVTFMSNRVSSQKDEHFFNMQKEEVFQPETDNHDGSELYKYVSKTVSLDNPATDLKIWFDVNRPIYTDYEVYIKTAQSANEELDDNQWVRITGFKNEAVVNTNTEDFTEVEINVNECLQNVSQPQLSAFSGFKIKLVGKSINPAFYPKFKTLRVVALT